ncbi:hypothetical protein [Microbaculum marinum]|uniref:N-acetyltransferase domain-containing protein n=1 Tax=Microbaculum marinum TaxID=1764581 RepID=A0AAW9RRN1_9HYPH
MAIARQTEPTSSVAWKVLDGSDVDAVYDLHVAAVGRVGRPDLIRPESHGFFESILAGGGRILGVSDAEGLLAYGVLQWDLPPVENLRPLFDLPADAPFAKLAGAAVRPGAWGRGLQESVIAERMRLAAADGLTHLYATSAPGNWRSWTNLLNQGFHVRALIEQYGGALRYILYRDLEYGDLEAPAPAAEDAGEWCGADAIHAQQRYLDGGFVGSAWRRSGDGSHQIFYRGPV